MEKNGHYVRESLASYAYILYALCRSSRSSTLDELQTGNSNIKSYKDLNFYIRITYHASGRTHQSERRSSGEGTCKSDRVPGSPCYQKDHLFLAPECRACPTIDPYWPPLRTRWLPAVLRLPARLAWVPEDVPEHHQHISTGKGRLRYWNANARCSRPGTSPCGRRAVLATSPYNLGLRP